MITPDLLKKKSLFASLPEEDLARLAQAAADVHLESDEWLVREGERLHFFVLLEGRLELSKELLGRDVVRKPNSAQETSSAKPQHFLAYPRYVLYALFQVAGWPSLEYSIYRN